jgi:hypothetical protein
MQPCRGEITLIPAEARPLEVRVALVQPHRSALGDLQGIAEIRGGAGEVGTKAPEGGAGQEAKSDELLGCRPTEVVHGSVQGLGSQGEPGNAVFWSGSQGQAELGAENRAAT